MLKLQFMAPSLSEYVSVVEQQSTGPSAQRSLDSDAQVSSSFHRWIGQFAVQKHMSIRRTVSMSFAQISIPLEPQSSPLSPPASICSLLRLWSPKSRSKWMESTKKNYKNKPAGGWRWRGGGTGDESGATRSPEFICPVVSGAPLVFFFYSFWAVLFFFCSTDRGVDQGRSRPLCRRPPCSCSSRQMKRS